MTHREIEPVPRTVQQEFGDRTLHGAFVAVAEAHPDLPAIEAEGRVSSYAEIRDRARRIAFGLANAGAGPGSVVGLCGPRSVETVAAMLGILISGAAFVMVDPDHPVERIGTVLDRCSVDVVLCTSGLRDKLSQAGSRRIEVADISDLVLAATRRPLREARAEDVAYIAYTSGSTGRPNGIAVTHASASNYLRSLIAFTGIGPTDRVLSISAFTFDASLRDIFGTLGSGATLQLPSSAHTPDPAHYRYHLSLNTTTLLLSMTPSVLRAICTGAGQAISYGLRQVLVSGEPLTGLLVSEARSALNPSLDVVNQYGPTECTMTSTRYRCPNAVQAGPMPIGRPIEGVEILIWHEDGRPAADGEVGEIHIGGVGVAEGYVGDPALTRARFVPHPLGGGGTLYRTGDHGWWNADGDLEYLGRVDGQLKIRGNRIEPSEVEGVLAAFPGVRQVAVTAQPGLDREAVLVAYIDADGSVRPDAVSRFARQKLPLSMVPSGIVTLSPLPLTSTGKLDRRALPPWNPVSNRVDVEAPETAIERSVAAIWASVLGHPEIGRSDDFFALGGHSLNALHMLAWVKKDLGIRLMPRALTGAPTLAAFCQRVEGALAAKAGAPASAAAAASSRQRPEHAPAPPTADPSTDRFGRAMRFCERNGVDSLVVLRGGNVVKELYTGPYLPEDQRPLHSATKTVTGLLAAVALNAGLLPPVETPVRSLLHDLYRVPIADPGTEYTLQDLLDMRSGIAWHEPLGAVQDATDTVTSMENTADWVSFILSQPLAATPGSLFQYNSGCAHLVMALIQSRCGGDALAFAERALLAPLGIDAFHWDRDPQGLIIGGDGLYLTPRDFSKIGRLLSANGAWNGRQLLSPSWLSKIHSASDGVYKGRAYINFVWTRPDEGMLFANGFNRQLLAVYPQSDLVIATTAHHAYHPVDALLSLARQAAVGTEHTDGSDLAHPGERGAARGRVDSAAAQPATLRDFEGRMLLRPNELGLESIAIYARTERPFVEFAYLDDGARSQHRTERRELGPIGVFHRSADPAGRPVLTKVEAEGNDRVTIHSEAIGRAKPESYVLSLAAGRAQVCFRSGRCRLDIEADWCAVEPVHQAIGSLP